MGASTSAKVTVSSVRVGEWCVGRESPYFLRLERMVGEKKVLMELWMEGIDKPRCFFSRVTVVGKCLAEGGNFLAGLGSDERLRIYQGWIDVGFRRLAGYAYWVECRLWLAPGLAKGGGRQPPTVPMSPLRLGC